MKKYIFSIISLLYINFNTYCQNIYISDIYVHLKSQNFDLYIPNIQRADSIGKRIITQLEYIHNPLTKTMNGTVRRFPIIIQPYTEQSNGFVNYVFRRSEFNLRPSQNYNLSGHNRWLDLLAIHEYRHIVQYYHTRRGLNRFAYNVFGSVGQAGVMVLKMRPWFFEGDAVYTETKHSDGGRGENSYFISQYLALLQQNKRKLTYNMAVLRSYRMNIPNHYVFGYLMVKYINKKYGEQTWNKIVRDTSKTWWIPGAMTRMTKKYTGKHISKHFIEMNESLRQKINIQYLSEAKPKSTLKSVDYVSYDYPNLTAQGIVYLKKDFDNNDMLVLVQDDGTEVKLCRADNLTDASIITADKGGNVFLLELLPSTRLKNKVSYSRVMVYNITERKRKYITAKTRFVSVAISPSGNQLLTLERSTDNVFTLKVYSKNEYSQWTKQNVSGGIVIKTFQYGEQLLTPRWSDDERQIVGVRSLSTGTDIIAIDTQNKAVTVLLESTEGWYGKPYLSGNNLFFESNIRGYTQVFRKDIDSQQVFELAGDKPIANTTPIYDSDRKKAIYISTTWDKRMYKEVSLDSFNNSIEFNDSIAVSSFHEKDELLTYSKIPKEYKDNIKFTVKKQKWNIIGLRPYRWGVSFNNPSSTFTDNILRIGIGIADKLEYINTQFNFYRYFSKNLDQYELKNTFNGFKLGAVNFNIIRSNYTITYLVRGGDSIFKILEDETRTTYDMGITIPIWLRECHYIGKLNIRPHIELLMIRGGSILGNFYHPNYDRYSMGADIDFSMQRPKHYRALTSRLGLSLFLTTRFSSYSFLDIKDNFNRLLYAFPSDDLLSYAITGRVYLPGVFKNDSFVITERYNHIHSNRLSTRDGAIFYDVRNTGIFRASYNMPFLYADIGFYSFFNIKRTSWVLNTDVYQDFNVESVQLKNEYRVSLQLDVNIFRLPQDMQLSLSYVKADNEDGRFLVSFNALSFISSN